MTPLEVAKETFKPHFCQFGHKRALYAMILVFGDQLNGVRADLNGLDTQKFSMLVLVGIDFGLIEEQMQPVQ